MLRRALSGVAFVLVLLLTACSEGKIVFTGSDPEASAIALGRTQGAPAAKTEAAATVRAGMLAATETPTVTPTCLPGFVGCVRATVADVFGDVSSIPTATPIPPPSYTVTIARWIFFVDRPGESDIAFRLGRFAVGAELGVYGEASAGHYLKVLPRGRMELTDLTADRLTVGCIEHDWGHPKSCHAHLYDDEGNLLGQIFAGVRVIAVIEEFPDENIAEVILQSVWISKEDTR